MWMIRYIQKFLQSLWQNNGSTFRILNRVVSFFFLKKNHIHYERRLRAPAISQWEVANMGTPSPRISPLPTPGCSFPSSHLFPG